MTVCIDDLMGSLRKSRQDYLADWRLLDDVLYRVCAEHPNHETMKAINAKLYLIGRSYATGIERLVKIRASRKQEQSAAMTQLAEHFLEMHKKIDLILADLPLGHNCLRSEEDVCGVVAAHSRLCTLVQKAGLRTLKTDHAETRLPTSFVSKYLHFHRPQVPVYDSYAAAAAERLCPEIGRGDDPYDAHAHRVWCLQNRIASYLLENPVAGDDDPPTVKQVDAFLLAVYPRLFPARSTLSDTVIR